MEINRDFYKEALEAYETSKEVFICNTSDLFCSAWQNIESREIISQHAQMFLDSKKQGKKIHVILDGDDEVDELTLFINLSDINSRDLRLEFLQWAVENINN